MAEVKEALVMCPDCSGRGATEGIACGPGICAWRTFKCNRCGGSGEVAPEVLEYVRVGKLMRQERSARHVSGREEAKRIGADVIEFNYLETGRGEHIGQFKEFREDGWPYCPQCEHEELYSPIMLAWIDTENKPTLAQCYLKGFVCYYCNWKSMEVA